MTRHSIGSVASAPRRAWRWLRALSGDDEYDRYLEHFREHHSAGSEKPLSRRAFFRLRQDERWDRINRCC